MSAKNAAWLAGHQQGTADARDAAAQDDGTWQPPARRIPVIAALRLAWLRGYADGWRQATRDSYTETGHVRERR